MVCVLTDCPDVCYFYYYSGHTRGHRELLRSLQMSAHFAKTLFELFKNYSVTNTQGKQIQKFTKRTVLVARPTTDDTTNQALMKAYVNNSADNIYYNSQKVTWWQIQQNRNSR